VRNGSAEGGIRNQEAAAELQEQIAHPFLNGRRHHGRSRSLRWHLRRSLRQEQEKDPARAVNGGAMSRTIEEGRI